MKTISLPKNQAGSVLLEALVALLLFSFGALGLLGLQAVSIKNTADAKYRADASYLTNQIIARMWVDRANMDNYAHRPTGAACAYTGTASANTNVTGWLAQIGALLPGVVAGPPGTTQIQVTTPVAGTKEIKVTVCWQAPQETSAHNFVTTARINE